MISKSISVLSSERNVMTQIDRLRQLTRHAGLDAMAIVPGANFLYLTGIDLHLMERPTLLFVPAEGKPVVILPFLEVMKWETSGIDAVVHAWRDAEGYEGAFEKAAH